MAETPQTNPNAPIPVDQLTPVDEVAATEGDIVEALADPDALDVLETNAITVAEDDQPPIGRSWAFDFTTGRFLPRPGGGPQVTHGLTTLRYWVEKCLRTERGAHAIHSQEYGLERATEMIGKPNTAEAVGDLEERIRSALTFHPRITDVEGFRAFPDITNDALYVTFRVVTDEGDDVDITDFAIA